MALKAILLDFNGVIIKDEPIHLKLIDEILLQENLQPQKPLERQMCLGRGDRVYFQELLKNRGRVVTEEYLTKLLHRKAQAYVQELEKLDKLPLYAGIEDLIFQVRSQNIKLGLVSGALYQEIEFVLNRAQLKNYFHVIVAGDDVVTSKPQPEGYLLAVETLNQAYPDLKLQSQECLAIEDTPDGIQAGKRAQMQVLGVANTYPFHMLQRQANWTVDYLTELELERVQEIFLQKDVNNIETEC
ncbi:MAG: HAD family phosphatase [Nostocales cyanobacterium]|nr:MAG: HAD family phosphatase [Nostocales cyanobacterium]TAF12270.1 MAG: HAD family phosphatase [Nostocales cyanobacterium]